MDERMKDFVAGFRASKQNFNGGTMSDWRDEDIAREISSEFQKHLLSSEFVAHKEKKSKEERNGHKVK